MSKNSIWVARDQNKLIYAYHGKPEIESSGNSYVGDIAGGFDSINTFPELIFETGPRELILKPRNETELQALIDEIAPGKVLYEP